MTMTSDLVKRLEELGLRSCTEAASALTQQEAEIARKHEVNLLIKRRAEEAEAEIARLDKKLFDEKKGWAENWSKERARADELQRKLDDALDLLVAVDSEFFLPGGLKDAVDAALSQKDETR